MMNRVPFLRRYMWQEWLKAFDHPELLAANDEANLWAKMETMRRMAVRDRTEELLLGKVSDRFTKGPDFMPTITLEGQRRRHGQG